MDPIPGEFFAEAKRRHDRTPVGERGGRAFVSLKTSCISMQRISRDHPQSCRMSFAGNALWASPYSSCRAKLALQRPRRAYGTQSIGAESVERHRKAPSRRRRLSVLGQRRVIKVRASSSAPDLPRSPRLRLWLGPIHTLRIPARVHLPAEGHDPDGVHALNSLCASFPLRARMFRSDGSRGLPADVGDHLEVEDRVSALLQAAHTIEAATRCWYNGDPSPQSSLRELAQPQGTWPSTVAASVLTWTTQGHSCGAPRPAGNSRLLVRRAPHKAVSTGPPMLSITIVWVRAGVSRAMGVRIHTGTETTAIFGGSCQ